MYIRGDVYKLDHVRQLRDVLVSCHAVEVNVTAALIEFVKHLPLVSPQGSPLSVA